MTPNNAHRLNQQARILLTVFIALVLGGAAERQSEVVKAKSTHAAGAKAHRRQCQPQGRNVEYCINVEGDAIVVRPNQCSDKIGRGGNLHSSSHRPLLGKCNGAGNAVRIETEAGNRYLVFSTRAGAPSPKDRSELASPQYHSFDQSIDISFDLRIPRDSPATDDFLYLLQLWQPCQGLPPIAGIRISRRSSHELGVVARGEGIPSPNKALAKVRLDPGNWQTIRIHVKPGIKKNGIIAMDLNDRRVGQWHRSIGYAPKTACPSTKNATRYRIKFGLYKGSEPDRSFEYHFDNVIVSTRGSGVGP